MPVKILPFVLRFRIVCLPRNFSFYRCTSFINDVHNNDNILLSCFHVTFLTTIWYQKKSDETTQLIGNVDVSILFLLKETFETYTFHYHCSRLSYLIYRIHSLRDIAFFVFMLMNIVNLYLMSPFQYYRKMPRQQVQSHPLLKKIKTQ